MGKSFLKQEGYYIKDYSLAAAEISPRESLYHSWNAINECIHKVQEKQQFSQAIPQQ